MINHLLVKRVDAEILEFVQKGKIGKNLAVDNLSIR